MTVIQVEYGDYNKVKEIAVNNNVYIYDVMKTLIELSSQYPVEFQSLIDQLPKKKKAKGVRL